MPFRLYFDARSHDPIEEFTAEMREQWFAACCENLSPDEVTAIRQAYAEYERRRQAKYLDDMHEHYITRAGGNPKVVMSVSQAKHYVRLRASESLRAAFEVFENVLSKGSSAPLKDQLDVASEVIKRAVGPAVAMNAMRDVKSLTELAPVDAIDTVMKAYAAGDCDENFVKTLLGLLGAKVNGLKVEQELDRKSTKKVEAKIPKPPSGKVV